MARLISSGMRIVPTWISAMRYLQNSGKHEAFNLFLEIQDPAEITDKDRAAAKEVDAFLRSHGCSPLSTVRNTIFPEALYRQFGKDGIFEVYPEKVYPIIKRDPRNGWGTYAHRLVRRTSATGVTINPLSLVLERMKGQSLVRSPKRSIYELDPIDPCLDLSLADPVLPGQQLNMGAPCLSHLSFKLVDKGYVNLTAVYRLHYYVQKTLGNLMGLLALQSFVANETRLKVGTLSVLSTFGTIEKQTKHFSDSDVAALVDRCAAHTAADSYL